MSDVNKFSDCLNLLKYHRDAMEVRRGLQLKATIAAVTFLLLATKGIHDGNPRISSNSFALYGLAIGFAVLSAIFVWMSLRIGVAHTRDRKRYRALEDEAEMLLFSRKIIVEDADKRSSPPKETWFDTVMREWATYPPIAAVLSVAACCWLYLYSWGGTS